MFSFSIVSGAVHIPGLGKQTLDQFIKLGFIRDIPDIFTLRKHSNKLLQISGWGEKKVANLLQNIEVVCFRVSPTDTFFDCCVFSLLCFYCVQMARQATFEEVLTGLGIPHVGKELAAQLAIHFGHINKLMSASAEELMKVPGVGTTLVILFWSHSHN
jgi:DNA ligase (NAD+)